MAQLIKGVVDTQIENLIPIGSTNAGDDTVIELSIKSNGQDFIFNNPTFEVLSKKEDNTKTRQIKDITLLDGKVKIKADIQLTLCKGIVTNQLIINDGDKISTVYFYFMVNPSLENEVLEESKDKIESLDKLDKLINTSFSDLEAYENKLLAFSAEMDSIVEVESKREANELIRSTSEVKRIYNEDSRIISEEDRIANEAIRVENEEARGLAESERVTNENNRRLAENTRKTQENARVAAEEQRQSIFEENENIRKEQEGKRVQAESVRKNKFNTWEEREGLRLISEDQRREAEESRQLAESNRDKAEKVREQQEANREATYNNFNNAEEERVNNESSRKDKENLRALAENSRVAAEKERVAAENTRNSRYETAESNRNNTFNSNENKRQSDYESHEGTRNSTFEAEERKRKNSYQDAENTRNNSFNQQEENRQNAYTVAERLRVENENLRKNNEATRGSNEETRKTNETSRVSSENIRVENENSRVAAEQKRQEDFKNIQSQYEHIVQENNNFKNEMNESYGNAKTDYFGEEHNNVVDRLNSDFDNVHQRINDASYLEYEGISIKADNSYFGLTKDLSIKGRTLQNVLNYSFLKFQGSINEDKYITLEANGNFNNAFISINPLIKPNTPYTVVIDIIENTLENGFPVISHDNSYGVPCYEPSYGYTIPPKTTGIFTRKIITKNDLSTCDVSIRSFVNLKDVVGKVVYRIYMIEGDYTNISISEIPFGEGIYSVGETENNLINTMSLGENLVDINKFKSTTYNKVSIEGDTITVIGIKDKVYSSVSYPLDIELFKGKTVYFSCDMMTNSNNLTSALLQLNMIDSDGKKIYHGLNVNLMGQRYEIPNNISQIDLNIYSNNTPQMGSYTTTIKNIKISISETKKTYTPYQESLINYQLDAPLRSLPNGVCDEIIRDELIRRVGEIVIDGTYGIQPHTTSDKTYCRWVVYKDVSVKDTKGKSSVYCDKFPNVEAIETWLATSEGITQNSSGNTIYLFLKKYSITSDSTTNRQLLTDELKSNPITVYYELAEPIITKLSKKAELKTYDGVTHFTSDNKLTPNLTVKVPSNVQAVLQDTRARNRELEIELETTTLKLKEADNILKEMDTDLIKTNWEMDDRLFEVEWALEDAGLVTSVSTFNINNKMRGSASVMALSKFEQAKIIIMSGDYDRVTLEGQLSKYLKRNIIAQDEYDTLISMMDAKEIVVGE